jgi:hypothetical protein
VGEVGGAMWTTGGEFDDLGSLAIASGTHGVIVANTAFRPLVSPCRTGDSRSTVQPWSSAFSVHLRYAMTAGDRSPCQESDNVRCSRCSFSTWVVSRLLNG